MTIDEKNNELKKINKELEGLTKKYLLIAELTDGESIFNVASGHMEYSDMIFHTAKILTNTAKDLDIPMEKVGEHLNFAASLILSKEEES